MKLNQIHGWLLIIYFLTAPFAIAADTPALMGQMNVGYQVLGEDDMAGGAVHLWFPTSVQATAENRAIYDEQISQHAASTTEFAGDEPFPLVVYSHGELKNPFENLIVVESLASHGFVVAAPTHILSGPPGNADGYLERVPVIKSTIDLLYELTEEAEGELFGKIRTDGVGAAGFSLSGHAVKALAGGAVTKVEPDDRVQAIMSNSAWGTGNTPEDIEIPTLLLAGEDDSFNARQTASLDLRRISSEDRFLTLFDGIGPCVLYGSTCNNTYAQEVQAILGVAFFDTYLRGNDVFSETLTQQFAVDYEPPFGFFEGAETDVNQDKRTDFEDFLVLADLFGKTKLGRQRRVDFDANGIVDFQDFLLLANNFSQAPATAGASVVPEPSSWSMATLALLTMLRWRRRQQRTIGR